jgi:uncharacterized protein
LTRCPAIQPERSSSTISLHSSPPRHQAKLTCTRSGRDRLWDLAERVYPGDPVVPADQALHIRNERRLRALGIARARGPECPVEPADVDEAGEPAVVDGVKGS